MANSVPSGITVEYDNSGGTPVNITQHVLSINGIDIEQIMEEVHSFGDSWEENVPIGIGKSNVIELSGLYDDTAATGPDALFKRTTPDTPGAATRTLKITWNSTPKSTAWETHLLKYSRNPDRGALTKYTVSLQTFGAPTEV